MNRIELTKYINNKIKNKNFLVKEIKGDASKRKYFRVKSKKHSYIVMDSFLEKRNFNNFLKYTKLFKNNNIKVPEIISIDNSKKILILEDFGNNLIYDKVNENNLLDIYTIAIKNIIDIQKIRNKNISYYKKQKYFNESFLFIDWVLDKFFLLKISKKDNKKLIKSLDFLIDNINHNYNKLTHRDYHSKNIFYKNKNVAIIDYQDALYGSPLYDFVSLVNDCYRDINQNTKNKFFKIFLSELNNNNNFNFSEDEFLYNFNLISAQRHMKASGIFCRLSIRNNRDNYLQHLNRTLNYIVKATSYYDNLHIINFFANEAINTLNESYYSGSR